MGGTRAIKAYIHNLESRNKFNITHVFAIDPPLDFHGLLFAEKKNNNLELTTILTKETNTQDLEFIQAFIYTT